jgi:serine protease Do
MTWIDNLKKQKFLTFAVLLFTLSTGVVIGTLVNTSVAAKEQQAAPDATPLVVPPVNKLGNEFSELVKKVEPSVVFIRTESKNPQLTARKRAPRGGEDEEGDDSMELFRRFFGGPNGPNGQGMPGLPGAPAPPRRREGSGSGFVVDKNGYIMTNNHVVRNADTIFVKFPHEDKEYKAKVIGTDKETDLAIIKIAPGKPLPAIRIANSDSVQVGDWAIAIGAPFGLETSVTVGIVSAKGRDINSEAFQRFIQTDAAINPGNSGGPLMNRNGEVIGVNTMIATESGGSQGIGFALPINMAAKVYNQLIQHGRVLRGSIGITFNKLEKPETLQALGLQAGVVVTDVKKGGPADKAGIKAEDILTAMNGKPFKDGDDLMMRIADTPVGTTVDVDGERNGAKKSYKVTIEDRQKVFSDNPRVNPDGTPDEPEEAASASNAKFGIGIVPLADADREGMGLEDKRGVKVTRVEPDSFAEEIGVQVGDVIVSINRTPVFTPDDVRGVQGKLKTGDAVAFRVMRALPGAAQPRGRVVRPQWQGLYLSGTLPSGN